MKRRFDPKSVKFPKQSEFVKVGPTLVKHQVNPFLTIEDKTSMGQVNRLTRDTLQNDKELKCAKATQKGLACTGTIVNLVVENDCMSFCKDHVNYIIRNFVNTVALDQPVILVTNPQEILFKLEYQENGWMAVMFGEFPEPFACEQSKVGDCLTTNFDFTSTIWEQLQVIWLLPPDTDVTEKDIRVGEQTVALLNQSTDQDYFISRILNQDYNAQHPEHQENVEEVCNVLDCFNFVQPLRSDCIGFCNENEEDNIEQMIDLLTRNRLFGSSSSRPGIAIEIAHEWKIQLIDESGHVEALVESKNLLAYYSIPRTVSDLGYGVDIYFTKLQARQARLSALWIQVEETKIPITRFQENDDFIKIQVKRAVPRRWAEDVDIPD